MQLNVVADRIMPGVTCILIRDDIGFCFSVRFFFGMFIDRCLSFILFFLLVIVLSVLRFKDYDYPFGIFKLFFDSYFE